MFIICPLLHDLSSMKSGTLLILPNSISLSYCVLPKYAVNVDLKQVAEFIKGQRFYCIIENSICKISKEISDNCLHDSWVPHQTEDIREKKEREKSGGRESREREKQRDNL